jgi:hypothetical protein
MNAPRSFNKKFWSTVCDCQESTDHKFSSVKFPETGALYLRGEFFGMIILLYDSLEQEEINFRNINGRQ